jgi:multisubunit Na+/H+ antiporter MnhC subunit
MSNEIIAVIALGAGIVLLLLWRTVRLFIRLAIFGIIILLVLGWLARGRGVGNPFVQNDNRPANSRPGNR